MIRRCSNPTFAGWAMYGGRGIRVCERWLGTEGFKNFLADMGERPDGKTLDRYPDKNGNYEPGNCRWATARNQARNTRRNRMITLHGKSQCAAAWEEETGILAKT